MKFFGNGGPRLAVGLMEKAYGGPPGFMDGRLAPGETVVAEMAASCKRRLVGHQKFSPPYLAVRPVAGSVHGQADDPSGEPIFGHTADNVGMVVLDGDDSHPFQPARILRGIVARMKVAGNQNGLPFRKLSHETERFLKEIASLRCIEVADMRAQKGFVIADNADRCFHLTAQGQGIRQGCCQLQRSGNEAAGSSQKPDPVFDDHGNGIVATDQDIAVVRQKSVSDARKTGDGLAITDADGFVRLVGARHDQRPEVAAVGCLRLKEEVMERGIREYDAHVGYARGHGR